MYHKVEDFGKWKKMFDSFQDARKAAGELNFSVGNVHGKPNTAYVMNGWKTIEEFEAFVASVELADAMKNAGVLEVPHTLVVEELDKG